LMSIGIDNHHQPHPVDPRHVLARQIARVQALGYDPIVATELECYICAPDWSPAQPNVQYSSLVDNFELEQCVAEMRQALLDLGIPLESSNPEYGPGQLEINFGAADPMVTADNTVLFKATVKEIARRHGLRATFMPKPYAGQSGSGLHVHTSLSQDGVNVFGRGEGHLLNDVMRHWVGGLILHAASISLIGIPVGNGYKRVRTYSFCPTHIHWGADNRSVLCRCTVDQGKANRVEYRAAGSDANPYLIIAAVLAAGADGLERQLDPGVESTGDQYADPGKSVALPATFAEGVAAFQDSPLMAALGPQFSENFMAMTLNELALYEANASGDPDDVTAWEFARYVEFS
jgi:glutamine synthetase